MQMALTGRSLFELKANSKDISAPMFPRLPLRMKRYFTPTKKGVLKCSEQAMRMFNDVEGRAL